MDFRFSTNFKFTLKKSPNSADSFAAFHITAAGFVSLLFQMTLQATATLIMFLAPKN
jgi:hypothetical protein